MQLLRWLLLVAVIAGLSGCRPAGRYPSQGAPKASEEEKTPPPPRDWAWVEPAPTHEVPILFVADTDARWAKLPTFWNYYPNSPAVVISPLGLDPLGAAVTFVLARQMEKVLVKVPRGLPDPTANIPASNPPTLAAWQLGKRLFFDKILEFAKYESMACATCHDPKTGFTEDWAVNKLGKYNTPSLINSVYNRHQFWAGRVRFLEQTIVTELNDENLPREERPARHIWGGLVKSLKDNADDRQRFREVFGVRHPTQDTIARALATYMRTILSGDSLFDRAEAERRKLGAAELTPKHFEAVLDDAGLKILEQTKKEDAAALLAQGARLFSGKARCVLCHPGPLFTDHDFHNIGLDENDIEQLGELNLGRFDHAPIGLKESRLRGAYKTPALRALPRTLPYMHNGQFKTLAEAVDFFDRGIDARHHHFLAPNLKVAPEQARPLELTPDEIRSLVLFLKSLDGAAVDPVVAAAK
jgi:cytochrome c peroxidase